jgi:hypothetical protein
MLERKFWPTPKILERADDPLQFAFYGEDQDNRTFS